MRVYACVECVYACDLCVSRVYGVCGMCTEGVWEAPSLVVSFFVRRRVLGQP